MHEYVIGTRIYIWEYMIIYIFIVHIPYNLVPVVIRLEHSYHPLYVLVLGASHKFLLEIGKKYHFWYDTSHSHWWLQDSVSQYLHIISQYLYGIKNCSIYRVLGKVIFYLLRRVKIGTRGTFSEPPSTWLGNVPHRYWDIYENISYSWYGRFCW